MAKHASFLSVLANIEDDQTFFSALEAVIKDNARAEFQYKLQTVRGALEIVAGIKLQRDEQTGAIKPPFFPPMLIKSCPVLWDFLKILAQSNHDNYDIDNAWRKLFKHDVRSMIDALADACTRLGRQYQEDPTPPHEFTWLKQMIEQCVSKRDAIELTGRASEEVFAFLTNMRHLFQILLYDPNSDECFFKEEADALRRAEALRWCREQEEHDSRPLVRCMRYVKTLFTPSSQVSQESTPLLSALTHNKR